MKLGDWVKQEFPDLDVDVSELGADKQCVLIDVAEDKGILLRGTFADTDWTLEPIRFFDDLTFIVSFDHTFTHMPIRGKGVETLQSHLNQAISYFYR